VIRDGTITFFVKLIMAVFVEDSALTCSIFEHIEISSSEQMPSWYRRRLMFVIPTFRQLVIAHSLQAEKGKSCECVL
jgi:hypothetical protein